MKTSLNSQFTDSIFNALKEVNQQFDNYYPGRIRGRQPVHTMYGGAQLYKADLAAKMGKVALNTLNSYAPNFVLFARAIGLPEAKFLPHSLEDINALQRELEKDIDAVHRIHKPAWLTYTIYQRVIEKLQREPVEDFRIDFEDGYGNRPDEEEDNDAVRTAGEVAKGLKENILTPFIGIRIKPLTNELLTRSMRTLDIFVTNLVDLTGGKLPDNFVITVPKVTIPEQVTTVVEVLEQIEKQTNLPENSLKIELMIETTQSLITSNGELNLPLLLKASKDRCVGAHFGTYDYTASCSISAEYQLMDHNSCDFARHMMGVAYGGTGIMLSDGATNIMPVGPHRGKELTPAQISENLSVVHQAWKVHVDHVRHSLIHGYYQGWDLHPNQLPTRYATLFHFFLKSLDNASLRLKTFVEQAAQATLVGDVFDDAATGQGLINFFLKGWNCSAITKEEFESTGINLSDLQDGASASSPWLKVLNR